MSDPLADRPIFIGGPHRSGTGMLRAVLGSNSQLALPPKEYLFFDRLPVSGDARADLAMIFEWPKVREWQLDRRAALTMLGTDTSRKAVYAVPLRAYAAQHDKPRFGEKTPYLERHFARLLDWFGPEMRFVHIIRDPLPTFVSLCHMTGERLALDPVAFARDWRASAMSGLELTRSHPRQFVTIRYEDFTADPEGWTERLCDFCGLPREIEQMLAMQDFARKQNSSFGAPEAAADTHGAIVATAAERHPRLSRLDRWLIERELGDLAGGIAPYLAADARLPVASGGSAIAGLVGAVRRLAVRGADRLH